MRIGVSAGLSSGGIGPAELGRALEERGFESLMVGEHSHLPATDENRSQVHDAAQMAYHFAHIPDPFVVLSAAAAVTTRLRLGTAVTLLAQRDTITTAKLVASLDDLSGGRFLFGVGPGWNEPEMRHHGVDPETRFERFREQIEAMKEIWSREVAEYHGRFVDFGPIFSWPKPVQRPHPPILVGGSSPAALRRVLDLGDAWAPMHWSGIEALTAGVGRLRELAEERDRAPYPVTVIGVTPTAEALDQLRELGVERAVLPLPRGSRDEALRGLDGYTRLLG
jgi:probable F420-dependent oxidoreductase